MIVYNYSRFFSIQILINDDFNDIVDHDKAADNEALSDFKSIDSSMNVDSISAENCDVSHVKVINVA